MNRSDWDYNIKYVNFNFKKMYIYPPSLKSTIYVKLKDLQTYIVQLTSTNDDWRIS